MKPMNMERLPSEIGNPATPRSREILKKYLGWVLHISVEPTMWLYMMAYMVTSVVEQAFFVYKACRVNHGFSEDVCRNISANKTVKDIVQLTVSDFHQWNNIASHIVPIVLALFFGNWSDRRGRKLPLIIGLLGKIVYSGMFVVNTLMPHWDVYMIIYTASIPMGMLGGDVAIFACCFAYISDISTTARRTFRVTLLDVVYLSTMPTGIAVGSFLFTSVFKGSYTILWIINTSLLILSVIYSTIVLKWQTNSRQRPLTGVNVFTDFFNKEHVIETFKTLTRRRPKFCTLHLWLLFTAMTLYVFQRDESHMSYLYTQRFFNWDVKEFSNFRTFQSSLFVIAMLVGTPTLSRVLGLRDTWIVIIGALSHVGGRLLFASASQPNVFYAGAAVAALGPVIAPVLRSMTSKVVPESERGKVFAVLAVCDNAVPFFSGVLYSQLFNVAYDSVPNAIYWLTIGTQMGVMILILTIHLTPSEIGTELERNEAENAYLDDADLRKSNEDIATGS